MTLMTGPIAITPNTTRTKGKIIRALRISQQADILTKEKSLYQMNEHIGGLCNIFTHFLHFFGTFLNIIRHAMYAGYVAAIAYARVIAMLLDLHTE
jgi:hypothetical protein